MNTSNEYEELRKIGFIGFAHRYLQQCRNSKSDDVIDIQVYTGLVQLDSNFGTTASEMLYCCLHLTTRSDIIKVLTFSLIKRF